MLPQNRQGKFRNQNIYFSTVEGRIEYVAASNFEVEAEMKNFFTHPFDFYKNTHGMMATDEAED